MRSTLSFLLATVLLTSVSTATPAFGPSFALSSRRLANQGALLNNREASFEKRQLDLGRLTGLAMGSNNPAPAVSWSTKRNNRETKKRKNGKKTLTLYYY